MEFLKNLRYPGRFIIFGKYEGSFVAIYGATGRSGSSVARKLVRNGDEIAMTQTAEGGNVELLTYPAVRLTDTEVVVANGRQIEKIIGPLYGRTEEQYLDDCLGGEMYEPDENKTPRISGYYQYTGLEGVAALNIIRSKDEGSESSSWTVPLVSGTGYFISTYAGEDVTPAPSFCGDFVKFDFGNIGSSAEDIARYVYDLIAPPLGTGDYRVGVVGILKKEGNSADVFIVNRGDVK